MIASMCIAVGRRPDEYAVVISFEQHVLLRDVSALFNYSFNIVEVDSSKGVCEYTQNIIRHYKCVAGDINPRIWGNEHMIECGLDKWEESIAMVERASEEAHTRETQRDMMSYVKALACTWSGGLGLGNTSCRGALNRSE